MANSTTYGKRGYLGFKKESAAGVAVYPDTFAEALDVPSPINWVKNKTNTVQGNRSANIRTFYAAQEPVSFTHNLPCEPNISGNLMDAFFGNSSDQSLNSGTSEQHDFQPQNTLNTFTVDLAIGGEDYITRFFGVRIASLGLSINDNRADWAVGFMAQKWFSNARVKTAVSSGTTLSVDQTSGLTTSDTIIVLDATNPSSTKQELTITSIDSETQLTTNTITASIAVDDIVVIQRKPSVTYSLGNEFIFKGGASVAIGTGTHPVDNTSAVTDFTNFSMELTNELEHASGANGNDMIDLQPSNIHLKSFNIGSFTLSHFHSTPEFMDIIRAKEAIGVRVKFLGDTLDSNSATSATYILDTDGSDTVTGTVDTAGEAGNDYNIKIVEGGASLSASISGKNITLTLDATTANNTTTAVASALNGLSGISSSDTGTDLVTGAINNPSATSPLKANFSSGRDANEVEMLRIDLPNAKIEPVELPIGDGLVTEELTFTADHHKPDQTSSNLSSMVKVRLRNDTASY